MQGPLAQLVALTCHGNAALAGSPAAFFPGNTSCQFCDAISFVTLVAGAGGKPVESVVAATPDAWFDRLRLRSIRGLRLALAPQNDPKISDRMTAGFAGGGGSWSITALRPDGRTEAWMPRWEVWNRAAPDRKIWRVTYGLTGIVAEMPGAPDLAAAAAALTSALRAIQVFSRWQTQGGFTAAFDAALNCLADPGRCAGYHRDLHPAGQLPPLADTLLQAVQSAWVFGGMGSWNDLGFDGEAEADYQRLSDDLFEACRTAILAAANSVPLAGVET